MPLRITGSRTNPRPRGMMDFAIFQTIIQQLSPATVISLAGYREPFLHTDLEKFIEYAASRGKAGNLILHSNFGAIPKTRIPYLLDLPFRQLIISLDSLDPETFQQQKGCDGFAQVYYNKMLAETIKGRRYFTDPGQLEICRRCDQA